MPWDTLGVSFNPAVVNDAESPVCNDNDNEHRQMSTPTYFLTIHANSAYEHLWLEQFFRLANARHRRRGKGRKKGERGGRRGREVREGFVPHFPTQS
jgi:hypothetical protein